jgi:hypothetical protein
MVARVIAEMIRYFDGDVRRINHALKVYGLAKTIGELEGLDSDAQQRLELAAVLHDIGIKESERKYGSAAGHYQEIEGPPVAGAILGALHCDPAALERIAFLIGNHHSYGKIDAPDFQILVEADFLVNIFEDSMTPAIVAEVGRKIFKTAAGKQLLARMYPQEAKE